MNLTSPTQVKEFLAGQGFTPSRLLGQNFLVDRNILDIICRTACLSAADRVLEVGPGLGVVTERLLDQAGLVFAVEKDRRLYASLAERFGGRPNLHLVNRDMLDVSAGELAEARLNKLVSNLPYSVGSRVLVDLMMAECNPVQMVVTVQLEVAQRLAAAVGTAPYGVLSVWAQAGYDVELVRQVSPGCFWPRPEVTSAIVELRRHGRLPLTAEQKHVFFDVTKQVFAHRRKQLGVSLARVSGQKLLDKGTAVELLAGAGIDPRARPENVSPAEWCELAKQMTKR